MSYASAIIGLCSLAVVSLLPPLAWHSHTKNIPAVVLITWLLIMNITCIVNAGVWGGRDFMTRWDGKGWCDLVIKLQVGANIGISCAVTNIVYNLHTILKADNVLPTLNSWKRIATDLSISLLCPIAVMGFSYLLQVFRYGIARYNGCQNLLSPTWITTVLYTMWMLIWSSIGTVYAFLVLVVFYRKRKDVRDILYCTNSGLNLTRFARLLIFCFLIILVMFPFSIYTFVQDLMQVSGHYSFKDSHDSTMWFTIIKFDPGKPIYNIWLYVLMSLLVFLIFGLGKDALTMYANFMRRIRLGFLLDGLDRILNKRKQHKMQNVLMKLSKDPESLQYSTQSCVSDEVSEKDILRFTSSSSDGQDSPISQHNHIEVDYRIPYNTKKKTPRNAQSFSSMEMLTDTHHKVTISNRGKVPYLAELLEEDDDEYLLDDISLSGLSKITASDNNYTFLKKIETNDPSSASKTKTPVSQSQSNDSVISEAGESSSSMNYHFKFLPKRNN